MCRKPRAQILPSAARSERTLQLPKEIITPPKKKSAGRQARVGSVVPQKPQISPQEPQERAARSPPPQPPPAPGAAAAGGRLRAPLLGGLGEPWGGFIGQPPAQAPSGGPGSYIFVAAREGNTRFYKIFFFFSLFRGVRIQSAACPPLPQKNPSPPLSPFSPPTQQPGPGCRAVPGDAARSLGRVITHLLIPPACSCSKPPGSRRVGGEVSGPPPPL